MNKRDEIRKTLQSAWDNSKDGFEIDAMTDAILALLQLSAPVNPQLMHIESIRALSGAVQPFEPNKIRAPAMRARRGENR